ncbi:MAG: hypothetical protein ACRDJP_07230 [Actinomycetota bacterium]
MDWLHISLRIVHIAAGIIWVGSAVFLVVFITPTAKELGPQAGPFMAHLNQRRRMPVVLSASSILTILAGIWLYWRDSDGFDPGWVTSSVGLAFTVGAVAAILAFLLGLVVARPRVVRQGELGAAMASGTPSQEQVQEMGALQRALRTINILNLALLATAVVAMSVARYLG